ncbi:hypothetical protein VOLCADRAFT_78603 [Volvox carteri f. nagariensis]|uniref:NFACT RNA-binding domain-containing protein n=1 Tax=Volvox carteri f. nagariensis TaxID=3068 RepID=D8TGX7_VOLCA|nr:uncharacterized protein VOLCADRAFT_78603 [Volvox carteri f. nagariensis]EFJ52975.1 hypothetical protein VOLCADRAFT_78603 [Volvox carteri f. nagariensis]|eukprot:XP_002945980.1 hypothetical protein VOLCADRAFT_78603 [Volvox carteri f. nagariensis]
MKWWLGRSPALPEAAALRPAVGSTARNSVVVNSLIRPDSANGHKLNRTTQRAVTTISSSNRSNSSVSTIDSRGAAPAPAGSNSSGRDGRNGSGLPPRLQPVDFSTLVACCAELRSGWVPAKVEQVVMPDKTSLCILLRTPSGQGWLRVCWHPAAGRLTMMTQGSVPERGNASELYSLGEQVREALCGLVLVEVSLPAPWERVANLQFGVRPGEAPTRHLYCEIMARYSNVILASADGEVLAAAYQARKELGEGVGGMLSSHRQVQVGRTYSLPPQLYGVPPSAAPSFDQWRDTLGRLVDGFIRAFHGVSPALVEEVCGAAGVTPEVRPSTLTQAQWEALYGQWMTWQERLRSGEFTATSDPSSGRYSVFGSLPRRHASVHEMLEEYYGPLAAAEAHAQLYGKLAAAVAAALKKARGKVRAFEQQLTESGRTEEVRRLADIITANLYRIPAGSPSAVVEDWETGEPLTLQLDPTKPPVATAEALYRKARKLRRAIDAVQPLLEEARSEVAYLEDVEPPPDAALAQKMETRTSKAAARAATRAGKKGGKRGTAAASSAGAAAAAAADGGYDTASARRYTSPGGFTVLVGRNNKQNDVLSTEVAADDDLWFHVRGMPGSHTLLRVPRGSPQPPAEVDVQFAANLAAFFSKARDSLKADVIVTRGAWVRKPRGAKPGAVVVSKELRNVVGRPGDSVAAAAAAAGGVGDAVAGGSPVDGRRR